jgi:hypothetical protein
MKKYIIIKVLLFTLIAFTFSSCEKDYGNLNSPTAEDFLDNANKDQLNNLVSGTESAMRIDLGLYLDDVSVIGREIYRFSNSDPRYYTDLLGANDAVLQNTGFYIVNVWASRYRVVKNCNLLIDAANNSTLISDAEKKGYTGFAKTIKAYQLLLTLNLTNANGIRIDIRSGQLGTHEKYNESLALLRYWTKAKLILQQPGFISIIIRVCGFSDAAGLTAVNRALAR